MEPRPSLPRHPSSLRVGARLAALVLALAASDAAADVPFPGAARVEAIVAAGTDEVERLASSPLFRRFIVYASVGLGLTCPPLALFLIRQRRREHERAELAREQQERASRVFDAARDTRPMRLRAEPAPRHPDPDGLPPLGANPPEVAARAVALDAAAVREAAERSLLLRAASERSETRRRAAALRARARARREEHAEPASAAAEPTSAAPEPPRAALPPAPPAAAAPESPAAAPPGSPGPGAADTAREPARVAILRASGPLTFEWLERTLARDPEDPQARLDLCTTLLVAERFDAAERVAREGLARDEGDGRLWLRLSEALAGLGRTEEALEAAVRAVRGHRSRKAILHLTRISALAHRFGPGDGPRLRKALETRPQDPVFLHALGVFESLHGSPREALALLRLALRQERSPRWRRIVSREIARLRARELGAPVRAPQARRAAG